jgi:hypothetical protein
MKLPAPLLLPVLLFGLFSGCQTQQQTAGTAPSMNPAVNTVTVPTASGQRPAWIYDPTPGQGKFGGVGSARRHIDGFSAQRQLAISRAIDEIARQLGVKVDNFMKTETSVVGQDVSSSMDLYSIQTTAGQLVQAQIRAFWETPDGEELFVWMSTL